MRPLDIFFGVMVSVLWGANFVAAKYGIAYFPPFYLTGLRFCLVSLVLIPFVPRPTRAQLFTIVPLSLMGTFHFSLLFVALYHGLDISSSALIGQLGVPFACLLGAIFLNDRMGIWRIFGVAIAFSGIAIVAGAPNILAHRTGFFLALGSTFSWGIANILIKRVQGMGSMQLLAWMSFFTVPFLFALSLGFEGPWPSLIAAPISALAGLSYTAFGSTIVAYGLWYYLLAHHTVSQVTPFSLLTPIFGIAFGQLFFHETLSWQLLAGGAITIVGVAVIVIRRPKTIMLGEAT